VSKILRLKIVGSLKEVGGWVNGLPTAIKKVEMKG
jgi:hypothetical protein